MAIDESTSVNVVVESENSDEQPSEQGSELSVLDLFRRIYQFFYSKTVGLVIILVVTVLVLVGVLIGQAAPGVYDDPVAKSQFLEQAAEKYGGWSTILDFLGFFHVFTSPIFLTVIGLLALSIIACTTHRIPQLWQRYRNPRTHVSDRFFDRARYRGTIETTGSTNVAIAAVRERLAAKRYRIIEDDRDADRSLYADKYGWGGFGTVIAHASFIIIIAAFVMSATSGIDETLTVPVGGDPVEVGHGTGLTLEAPSFEANYNEAGRPIDYVSHLILRKGDATVGEQDTRVNEPLRYESLKFHQLNFGIAADVTVTDASGATLYDGTVPLQWTSKDGTNVIGKFLLEKQGLEVLVIAPASGARESKLAAGQGSFEVYRIGEDQAVAAETAEQGVPVKLGELSATFEREREYTGIMIRQDPGAIWMWIGSALLVIGMTITFTCRHRRVWIRVDDIGKARIRFGSADKKDLGFERQFKELILDISSTLEEKDRTEKEGQHD